MAEAPTYQVDYADPARLAGALDQYLSMSVCLVENAASPGPLKQATLELLLPGGTKLLTTGRVIQEMGPAGFLVQLSGNLDLARLRDLAETGGDDSGQPAETGGDDSDQPDEPAEESWQEAAGTEQEGSAYEDEPEPAEGPGGRRPGRGRERPPVVRGDEGDSSAVYKEIRELPMLEKQRLARRGRRTVRQLLVREPNKNLHILIVKNPKITLDEIIEFTKMPSLSQEALKIIAQNRTWTASRQVMLNLVRNPSTPQPVAIALLSRLPVSDLRIIARSTSVRVAIANHAKKVLFGKRR